MGRIKIKSLVTCPSKWFARILLGHKARLNPIVKIIGITHRCIEGLPYVSFIRRCRQNRVRIVPITRFLLKTGIKSYFQLIRIVFQQVFNRYGSFINHDFPHMDERYQQFDRLKIEPLHRLQFIQGEKSPLFLPVIHQLLNLLITQEGECFQLFRGDLVEIKRMFCPVGQFCIEGIQPLLIPLFSGQILDIFHPLINRMHFLSLK